MNKLKLLVNLKVIYLYLTLSLLTSGYVLLSTDYGVYLYVLLALSVPLMLMQFFIKRKKINISLLVYFLLMYFIFILSTLINFDLNGGNSVVKFTIIMLFSFLLVTLYQLEDTVKAFLDLMFFISIVAITLYFLTNFIDLTIPSFEVVNSNDITYKYSVVYAQFDSFLRFRNSAIFWEPGIFASFLIISLYLELYFYNGERTARILIFIISLVTTLSSAGLVLFILFFISLLCSVRLNFMFILRFSSLLIIGFSTVIYTADIVSSYSIDPMRTVSKIMNPVDTEGDRISSPMNLLKVFYESPFYGVGIDGAFLKYSQLGDISLTSTTLFYLSSFGLLSIVTLLPFFLFFISKRISNFQSFLLLLSYLLILNKELHVFFSSYYIILFYFFVGATSFRIHRV